jgi:hypothetical protein
MDYFNDTPLLLYFAAFQNAFTAFKFVLQHLENVYLPHKLIYMDD